MQNFVQRGRTLDLVAPYVVPSGGGFMVGKIFAVANDAALLGAPVYGDVEGVFNLPKAATVTFSVGDYVYWDNTNLNITGTSTGNTKIGVAVLPALANDVTVRVRLNGSF